MSSQLIRIDSQDKSTSSVSNSNFRVNLGNAYRSAPVTRIVLKQIQFPNNFYNVRTGVDDVLTVQENGQAPFDVTIPQGFWEITDLLTEMKTQIDAGLVGGSTVTITLGNQDKKLLFTFSGTTAIVYANASGNSTIATNLGILQTTPGMSTNITGNAIPSLEGLTEVFLISDTLAPLHTREYNNNQRNIFASIPITAPFTSQNIYRSQDEELDSIEYPTPGRLIRDIDIRLENREGEAVNLSENHDVKIIFKVYYSS